MYALGSVCRIALTVRRTKAVGAALAVALVGALAPTGMRPAAAAHCSGVVLSVGTNLQAAFNANSNGTTFCLQSGTHRATGPLTPKTGQKIIAEPGAIISGAKLLTGWVADGSTCWKLTGQIQETPPHGTCHMEANLTYYSGGFCNYNEWVYYDGFFMRRVGSIAAVGAGQFFFDYPNDTIYIGSDPTGHVLEGSHVPILVEGNDTTVTGVEWHGVIFQMASNRYQQNAVRGGTGWIFDGVTSRLHHSAAFGVDTGKDGTVIRNSRVENNGGMGLGSYQSTNHLVEGNDVSGTQTLAFFSDGDGSKWVGTTGLVVRNNHFHDNVGTGIWLDYDNVNALVENNISRSNGAVGLHDEINCGVIYRNNLVENNEGAGIQIVASTDVDVYNNRFVNNGAVDGDVRVYHQDRTAVRCTTQLSTVTIHDNVIGMSRGKNGLFSCCAYAGTTNTGTRTSWYANKYYAADTAAAWWQAMGVNRTFSQWQSLGYDATSTLGLLSSMNPVTINEPMSTSSNPRFIYKGGTWNMGSFGELWLSGPVTSTVGVANHAVHTTGVSGNYTMKVDAALMAESATKDVAMLIGYANDTNYLYASFSPVTDANNGGIFRVTNGVVTKLKSFTASMTAGTLYQLKVGKIGTGVTAYLNNVVLGTVTVTLPDAGVAIGSRDDGVRFDNLLVHTN